MQPYLVAHDLGTSGNKASLFTAGGTLVRSVTVPYAPRFFAGDRTEQNPDDWWSAVCEANHRLLEGEDKSRVAGVSFSGQMMGCVPVDRQGRALRPAIIWADRRSREQEKALRDRLSDDEFYRITGHRISASYSLEKWMWIRDREPDVFSQTYKMLQPKDFIIHRLTGAWVTDYSDASGTNCLDLEKRMWSHAILEAADMPENILPDLHASTDIAGTVPDFLSTTCGLPAGTPVVIGAGDGVCAAVGAGSVAENQAYACLGSSAWVAYTARKPVYDPQRRTYNWAHMVPGYVTPNGTMQAAGQSYAFLRRLLYSGEEEAYRLMDEAASASEIGAGGLLFLPYLLGERSPRWNPKARGAFVGLTMEHTKGDLVRAGLEGILMNLGVILSVFTGQAPLQGLRLIGGLANGALVPGMLADITGLPVYPLLDANEATGIGAAVAAGVGTGVLPGFEAVDRFLTVRDPLWPDPARTARYARLRDAFEQCYRALVPVYDILETMSSHKGE